MKAKILFSIAVLFFGMTAVNAQISEGKYLLGGSISFISNNNQTTGRSDSKSNYFNIEIQAGKFFQNASAAGILLSYGHSSSNSVNSYGAGVFYRKYVPLATNFYFFGEGALKDSYATSAQYNSINSEFEKYINNNIGLNFIPGISYSIRPKIQLELSLPSFLVINYSSSKNKSDKENAIITKTRQFNIDAGINSYLLSNLSLGFKLLLGK